MLGLHALGSRMRSEHSQALRLDRQQELRSPSTHPSIYPGILARGENGVAWPASGPAGQAPWT